MDQEIRFIMIQHQFTEIFIATVHIIPFPIPFQIIEITMRDRSVTPKIKIETEETRKDLLKDINFSLMFSILRGKKDLKDKIAVISIIFKLKNLECLLKTYFKASHLMKIFCNNFR
jgi:hypothetical protein